MTIYKSMRSIPVIGTLLSIVNAYAFRGDYEASQRFAGFRAYICAFLPSAALALLLALLMTWGAFAAVPSGGSVSVGGLNEFSLRPGGLIVSVLPSLLGFGIGVYALTFALSAGLVRQVDEALVKAIQTGRRRHGSALVINADLSFPLIVLVIVIAIGVAQQAYPNHVWFICFAWFCFWYAMVATIEIIGVLFELGDHVLLEKRAIGQTPKLEDK